MLLDPSTVREFSEARREPSWMLELRLRAAELVNKLFDELPIDVDKTLSGAYNPVSGWEELPKNIRQVYEALELPEAERNFLAGIYTQVDNTTAYTHAKKLLEEKGVIFLSMDEAVRKHPSLIRRYFSKLIPYDESPEVALNTALWQGGTFIYVPKGVKLSFPVQSFFMINERDIGQVERTLIILEEGAELNYVEGCTALVHRGFSYHLPVGEVFVKSHAKLKYTTLQNWSRHINNVISSRALVSEYAFVEWFDGNIGSKMTKKKPHTILAGKGAKMKSIGLSYAGNGQELNTGVKVELAAPRTRALVRSIGIAQDGGKSIFEAEMVALKDAENSVSRSDCDSYFIGEGLAKSYPLIRAENPSAVLSHEARVGSFDEEKLFYLRSRGLGEDEALKLMVAGVSKEFLQDIPFEYAVEFKKMLTLRLKNVA